MTEQALQDVQQRVQELEGQLTAVRQDIAGGFASVAGVTTGMENRMRIIEGRVAAGGGGGRNEGLRNITEPKAIWEPSNVHGMI